MVFITKTVFIGSDGNKTTEINESSTIELAEINKTNQIDKWYNILIGEFILPIKLLNDCSNKLNFYTIINQFKLNMINFTLSFTNKHIESNVLNSFSIEIYEENN
jgi:hypothetical protein